MSIMEQMDGILLLHISRRNHMFPDTVGSECWGLFLNHLIDRLLIRINELPPLNEVPPGQTLLEVALNRMGHFLQKLKGLFACLRF